MIVYIGSYFLFYGNLLEENTTNSGGGTISWEKMEVLPLMVALAHEAFCVLCCGISIWNVVFVWRECQRNVSFGEDASEVSPHVRLEEEED